jgi:flagellar motor protein MotB
MKKTICILLFITFHFQNYILAQTESDAGKEYPDGHGDIVYFPMGDLSFADEVVSFEKGNPEAKEARFRRVNDILGVPDYRIDNEENCITLGCGGSIVVRFTNNALSDVPGPDLYIFETGPAVEPTSLSISNNGTDWISIGKISGGRADIDINSFVKPGEIFHFVKLTDMKSDCNGDWPGADIDAVAAIGSVMHISLNSSLMFDRGKYDLKPEAKAALDSAAQKIKTVGSSLIIVEGHTDNVGNKDLNKTLSDNRANIVKDYLVSQHKMNPAYLTTIGYGGSRPIANNDVEETRQKNRRVAIIVKPKPIQHKINSLYTSYDKAGDISDNGYPRTISEKSFPGLWKNGFDDAINDGNGKIYFFKGSEYISYDLKSNRADEGYPKPISQSWPGLWADGIDAAMSWEKGKVCFFKGSKFMVYDMVAKMPEKGYPKAISHGTWNGVWPDGVDAAINWGNGKAYFFKGDEYVRYDLAAKKVDEGYPMAIPRGWQGVLKVDAIAEWENGKVYIFKNKF